ncbi:hypothetical protein [Streptomyces sp. PR69]|uniref:hypothetical protein n=1 Tax=Streptomyces sp. PR69 TaxID=2984950 RepID=UPI0022655A48|nr:hypothetical protein [Streptomyces sp. PR69]
MPLTTDLRGYEIDPVRGFLPARDPLERLPAAFRPWEDVCARLPALMAAGRARDVVGRLEPVTAAPPHDRRELWRAYMLLSLLANAYVMDGEKRARTLPRAVALPLCETAAALDMPPIPTYATLVLHNWARVDRSGPLDLDNLVPLCPFSGGMDEQWFFLSMAAIEAAGGPSLAAIADLGAGIADGRPERIADALTRIADTCQAMIATLRRIPERCDPYIYFHRVRPPMAAWGEPGVVYEGVGAAPESWDAASGAQSALLQALDAALGVRHGDDTGAFLRRMRTYMPPGHRRFLADLEAGPSVRDHIVRLADRDDGAKLRGRYNDAVDLLDTFRRRHMEITVRYLSQQSGTEEVAYGTGGTDFVHFLHHTRREASAHRIGQSGHRPAQDGG